MGSLVGAKKVKAPKATAVSPVPEVTTEAEDEALRKQQTGKGFASQIFTGDLVPPKKGKGVLG